MNIADWSIQDAIKERVRQEDLVQWAQREEEPFVTVPGLPYTPSQRPVLSRFISSINP